MARRTNYGAEASRYVPPPEMLRIAEERTQDIVGAWGSMLRFPSDPMPTIHNLAESCYMQAIHDIIDAMNQRGLLDKLYQPAAQTEVRNLPA